MIVILSIIGLVGLLGLAYVSTTPNYEKGKAEIDQEITMPYGFDLAKCRYVETLLKRVRSTGNYSLCKLPIQWQEESIRLAPGAFELFLINVVWMEIGGHSAKVYRWGESFLRNDNLETIQKDKDLCLEV